jgi:hypothetical protein
MCLVSILCAPASASFRDPEQAKAITAADLEFLAGFRRNCSRHNMGNGNEIKRTRDVGYTTGSERFVESAIAAEIDTRVHGTTAHPSQPPNTNHRLLPS